jgi:hypothetical protein
VAAARASRFSRTSNPRSNGQRGALTKGPYPPVLLALVLQCGLCSLPDVRYLDPQGSLPLGLGLDQEES